MFDSQLYNRSLLFGCCLAEPRKAFVEAISSERTCSLDVPISAPQGVESKFLNNL